MAREHASELSSLGSGQCRIGRDRDRRLGGGENQTIAISDLAARGEQRERPGQRVD